MMRKVLAILFLLISSPAFSQQIDWSGAINVPNVVVNPTMNDCPSNMQAPTCGAWQTAPGPGDWSNQFGSTEYVFSYTPGMLFQDIDLSSYKTKKFNFIFQFDLNNSCRNSIGGYCQNVNGPIDEFSATLRFYDINGLNNEFTFLNGNPSTARIECDGLNFFGLCLLGYSAIDNWQHFGWYSHVESDSLFTSARVEFTGRDVGFWGGLYGPRVDNPTLMINYLQNLYWIPVANENGSFTVDTTTQVRYGADGIYATQTFEPGTYSCSNGVFGDPIGGVVKHCEIGSLTEPVAVNCTVDPANPDCAIKAITDPSSIADEVVDNAVADATISNTSTTDTSPIVAATTTTTTETPTQSAATTEIVANTSTPVESFSEKEKASDPVLAASVASEAVANAAAAQATNPLASTPGSQAAYRELTDEEKAAILADAISKNVIEGALTTIAATAAASSTTGSQETTSTAVTAKTNMGNDVSNDNNSMGMVAENNQQQIDVQETNSAMDILDTGRTMGQQALTNILATSAEFADQAGQQAESIAQNSSVNTGSQVELTVKDINQEFTGIEIPIFSQDIQKAEDVLLNSIAESIQSSEINMDFGITDDGRPKEIPGVTNSVELEQQTLAVLDVIKQSAETQTFEDENKQYEEVMLSNNFDPSAAAAFGAVPSVMNLEILGVIGNNKPEEKSDAEKRADQIVAANQQQMEEINKNYMEADQSGIIGAIGADGADVRAYRTAMLSDAAQWYKDKDIYKGIIIKDNVRGSYFLEKGNTDTYKKMVEEQYR